MIRTNCARLVAVFGIISFVTACGGAGSRAIAPVGNPNFTTSGIPSQLLVKNWGQELLRDATYVGPVSGAHATVNVLVHQRDAYGVIAYAREANDPNSPNYRHWLTPQEIGDRFGADANDYAKTASYFQAQGLAVGAWPQRMLLSVSGAQSVMERAFGTSFGLYRKDGQEFIAPVSAPHFATALPVDAVGRLTAYNPMHSYLMNPLRVNATANLGYSPQQIQAAFDYTNAYAKGFDGTGITIGIIATGPVDNYTGGTGSGDHDLDALAQLFHLNRVAQVTEVPVTGTGVTSGLGITGAPGTPPPFPYASGFASPPPVSAPCIGLLPACNPEDQEAQLDVQQSATLAPGAHVNVYLGYNPADCSGSVNYPSPCPSGSGAAAIGILESDPEIQQVIADNTADIISMSFGGGESQFGFDGSSYASSYLSLEFAALAAEGIAAFASSGDNGSAECSSFQGLSYAPMPCVDYPGGDENVTSVGGVTAPIDGFGRLTGPILAWGISTANNGYGAMIGSGGGTSAFIPAPAWQQQALGVSLREQPDVSLIGDPNNGVALFVNARFPGSASGPSDIGGTSVAAPEMAAMWALVLSACAQHPGAGMCPARGHRLGNAAPYFYRILKGSAPLSYQSVFYDVLYGSNEMSDPSGTPSTPIPGQQAMAGYDEVTGVGVPFAAHLIQAVTGINVP